MTGPDLINGMAFARLISVPRVLDGDLAGTGDRSVALLAPLVGSHAELSVDGGTGTAAVAVGWVRPPGADQLHFLVGGRPRFPPFATGGGPGPRPLLYPPGSLAEPVDADSVRAVLQQFPAWLRCAGRPDALWARDRPGERERPCGGTMDDLAAHLGRPFAWLIVAEPLPREATERERSLLAVQLPRLRQRENSELDRLELERAQARYRELTKALVTGLWDVHVLVGGETESAARQAAAVLCGSSDLAEREYALVPGDEAGPLDKTAAPAASVADGATSPFRAGTALLAAVARPPYRELPGIRTTTRHSFDVTPETERGEFEVGVVLDEGLQPSTGLSVSRDTLNRHAFVCGATGSGKSQTVRTLLETLSRSADPVPWLVIEPAKAEYARMSGRLAGAAPVLVIRPGELDAPPASINPLEPEPGFGLQGHLDLVRALFLAAFEAQEPFPQVLSRALTECYRDAGWDLVTGAPRPAYKPKFFLDEPDAPAAGRYPSLGDLQATAQRVVGDIGYGTEVTADVRGFVDVRIGSLRDGAPGRFFEGGHPLDIAGLLRGNVVLELEGITNDQDKAFLMGAVLIRIVEHLRVQQGTLGGTRLRHVTVVEEAHRLLKNVEDGPAAAAVELFASLLAEIRAYGEGVVVVEQIPAKILPDVIKNTALKVMHRLPAADDRVAVGATMNLREEQSEYVVALPPGEAAVAADGMDRPLLVRMRHGERREDVAGAGKRPPLLGRRSRLCGVTCAGTPCTLREMNETNHLARDPLLVLWVEAVVASTVIGFEPPVPSRRTRSVLHGLDQSRTDCALAYAVDRSVAARRGLLRRWMDPDDVAEHVRGVLTAVLVSGAAASEPSWCRWTAGIYRWADVRQLLLADAGADEPHPLTAQWGRRGLVLDGSTTAEQLDQLMSEPVYAQDQEWVSVGDAGASGLRDAVLALTGTLTAGAFADALRRACAGPALPDLVPQMAGLLVSASRR